jgi:hypothetical protein
MSLSNHQSIEAQPVSLFVPAGPVAAALEGTAVALPLASNGASTQWTYSDTAEGLTGAVAANGFNMDGQPGLIYSGPVGGQVRISITNLDLATSLSLVAEADDGFAVGVFKNNDLVGKADEGFAVEFDTATVEYNCATIVGNMQTGDVLRVAVITEAASEDGLLLRVVNGGEIVLS